MMEKFQNIFLGDRLKILFQLERIQNGVEVWEEELDGLKRMKLS